MSSPSNNKKRKPRIQTCVKRLQARCAICPESRYTTLEAHRIIPGEQGGKYVVGNVIALCASCHSLVTAGEYKTLGIRSCSFWPTGVLHWIDDKGEEHFSPIPMLGEIPPAQQ
jgi:5-methylcytosine-specific restriction endonuclease McrA